MIKMMFHKRSLLLVAVIFCALAMNVNTALGFNNADEALKWLISVRDKIAECEMGTLDKALVLVSSKYNEIIKITEKIANEKDGIDGMKIVIKPICHCSDDPEDIKASFLGICCGISPKFLEKCSLRDRMSIPDQISSLLIQLRNDKSFSSFFKEAWSSPKEKCQLNLDGHLSSISTIILSLSSILCNTDLIEGIILAHCWIDDSGAISLAGALSVNSSLTQLNLEVNKIGNAGAISLADALKVNSSLTQLNLEFNKIGNAGAISLADALKVNSSITQLNLGGNPIGADGAKALADALKVNSFLKQLSLRWNGIGNDGAISLADALKVNSSLALLDLGINVIEIPGAISLADALKVNSSLTQLGLEGNFIGADGAKALAGALKVNSSLAQLNLELNEIGNDGAISLAEALEVNSSLKQLYLRRKDIGDSGANSLARVWGVIRLMH